MCPACRVAYTARDHAQRLPDLPRPLLLPHVQDSGSGLAGAGASAPSVRLPPMPPAVLPPSVVGPVKPVRPPRSLRPSTVRERVGLPRRADAEADVPRAVEGPGSGGGGRAGRSVEVQGTFRPVTSPRPPGSRGRSSRTPGRRASTRARCECPSARPPRTTPAARRRPGNGRSRGPPPGSEAGWRPASGGATRRRGRGHRRRRRSRCRVLCPGRVPPHAARPHSGHAPLAFPVRSSPAGHAPPPSTAAHPRRPLGRPFDPAPAKTPARPGPGAFGPRPCTARPGR
ncbi:MAG: hypothetical protein JWO31_3540 [Phycisphaerales bacterium]|nr:hypothetical protein [Phycisphaerales bacterium]